MGIIGFVVIFAYIAAAVGLIRNLDNLTLALLFCIGPVAIIGVLEINRRLTSSEPGLALKAGTEFLIIAFVLFTLMLVVQVMVRLQAQNLIGQAGEAAKKEMLTAALQVTDYVQLGIDVAFDIFYCLGLILLSAVMYGRREFGRILGVFGIVSGAALLVLNLWAFPEVPGESGLVDLGPVTAIWWLAVIVQMVRHRKQAEAGLNLMER